MRFAFGGLVTALTGVVANAFGPSVGGLFLAFPAILPASLTLLVRHERRRDATEHARGAIVGAGALIAFATTALALPSHGAVVALGAATATWIATAVVVWACRDTLRSRARHVSRRPSRGMRRAALGRSG